VAATFSASDGRDINENAGLWQARRFESGALRIGIHAAFDSVLPFACSFTSTP
jgi:hypothetical protein